MVKASNKEGNINVPYFTAEEVKKLAIEGHDIHEAAKCKGSGIAAGHGRFAGIICVNLEVSSKLACEWSTDLLLLLI